MSTNTEIKDLNYYIDWLNNSIDKGHIECYEYSDFKNIQPIGSGSYGNVVCGNWKSSDYIFALKSFKNDKQTFREVLKELKLHRSVNHENIIRLYGITELEIGATHQMNKYSLVLEYADSGTLNAYLDEHFNELNWSDKFHFALQLANAVEFLHKEDIIHRDMHANNILVHQKNIKLADFGLSKKIAEASSNTSKVHGIIPYMDPKSLYNDKNQSQNYKLTKKSDVYSIGVLMWQISSGYEPFKNKGYDYDLRLLMAIVRNELRENIINGTPVKYCNLYTECWKYEPNERPNTQEVVSTLKAIISSGQNDLIIYNPDEEQENYSFGNLKSTTKLSRETIDINDELINISNIGLNINNFESSHLEENDFITPDEKVKKLIKELTETKFLYTLKLLFEDLQNEFSPKVLIDSLEALANPTLFNYYSKEIAARLELHLRTLVAVLERICFSPIVLSKALQDKVYNSLAEFMEIHHEITQVIETETNNNFSLKFNQKDNEDSKTKKCNYNVEFLLIHLRDTLHSLRDTLHSLHDDNKTWFQELLGKVGDLLMKLLNITPGILLKESPGMNDDNSILLMLTQLRQNLSFKYPIASYYVDWKIMLIIQHNLFTWSESSEKIISKKFGELVLMEYIWSFLEREWINVDDKSILNSQIKFEEVLNKISRNTGSFLNDSAGNEPLTFPHTLWFGILDLAQNLIKKSNQIATYGLCYYLAIESLNKAPSCFIQFKAIEILLHLHYIDNQMFSMIEPDFDQYKQKLSENKSTTDSSEKFQNLLTFVKEKYFEDLKILNDYTGKGKALCQNTHSKRKQGSNPQNILNIIADEMTCPISSEPTDQLCILKCQHTLSFNSLKKLKQKMCPKCRKEIKDSDVKYLSQNTIYKSLYSQFFEAGYILPELEDSGQIMNNQCDSNSDNPEVDLILVKKKKFIKTIKLNSNILSLSILPRISKKQHPTYQNAMKELDEKNYAKAEHWCKEFLKTFPKSYSIRCILAYIYRCLNNYKQAHLYLDEAIDLKEKNPIAYFIHGEIFFRQSEYAKSIVCLEQSLSYKAKINKLYVILGNSSLFEIESDHHSNALTYYNIALQNDPNNYLCLKNCAFIYEKYKKYLKTLEVLDKLLSINKKDSLILCYYGEILSNVKRYNDAILYFTKANIIDPENAHNLNKRAIIYYVLQKYDKVLLDLDKVIQLNPLNSLAYYYKGLTCYTIKNIGKAILAFKKCIELNSDDNLSKIQLYYLEYLQDKNSSKNFDWDLITKINQISNINDDKSLLFIRCKIYIELKKYKEAKSDLDILFIRSYGDISFIYLLREYSDFWSYLYEDCRINFTEIGIGIVKKFNQFMYKEFGVYFISNLTNLNSEFCQFQENDSNSLSGRVLSFKGKVPKLKLPLISNYYYIHCYVIWKIKVKKISKDCFIKFMIADQYSLYEEHVLEHDVISKLEGLGWIEYKLPNLLYLWSGTAQHSIEINGSVDMQMDYVRYVRKESYNKGEEIYFPKMGHLFPIHKICQNVPEAFKDKYFSRNEMENLLELKDIINNLN